MSGDKKIETYNPTAPSTKSELSINPETDMGKDGLPSESVAAGVKDVSGKDATNQPSDQGAYYPPTSCYDYYYPGFNGSFSQSDDKGVHNTPGGSYAGMQQDNASLMYYVPGYGPYSSGFVGVDGKQAYPAPEYLQQSCSYGSEAFPCYTYDLAYSGNGSSSNKSGSMKSASGSGKTNGFNVANTNSSLSGKTSPLPYNSRSQQPNSSRSIYQNQSFNPLNKFGVGIQSPGHVRGIQPAGNFSPYTSRNPSSYSQYGSVNYQSNGLWNNNYRSRSRENFGRSVENRAANELTRGPRADYRNPSKLPAEVEQLGFAVEREKYNLQEFEIVYDSAKFYVIKSYSEDDVHKCIKYDVWSSTPNGNKKLDAAFREADAKMRESGKKCPVFLFFSVNASGQFVGVAEMIGPVDFSKNMDFWQLDKWNGFFPLKWHIIKDVPNTQLRHIILENNENRAVTFSRDTQEIELKQGLEMLSIFKNYSAKTCLLDDFNFYENREKELKAKRGNVSVPQTNSFSNGDYEKRVEAAEPAKKNQSDSSSLVELTKNLSLEPQPPLQSSI